MDNAKSNTSRKCFKLISAKEVIKFFCLFILIYVLLMAPWPGLRAAYSKFYMASSAFLSRSFGSKGIVLFEQSNNPEHDVNVVMLNRDRVDRHGKPVVLLVRISSRYGGYMYMAFVIALIVATPISLRRRAWALVWGLILMHTFVVFKLGVMILHCFSKKPLSLFVLNPFWKQVLVSIDEEFSFSLTFGFVVGFVVWVLVSFRRRDLAGILMYKKEVSKVKGEK